jgi:hypothetical protein
MAHGHLDLEAASLHDVPVVDLRLREYQDFLGELLELLLVQNPGLLDGDGGAVGDDATIDNAVTSSLLCRGPVPRRSCRSWWLAREPSCY